MRGKLYDTDLSDAAWTIIAPLLPPAKTGGRPRTPRLRPVLDAIFYLLRTGCQWRLLLREVPPWSTAHHDIRAWKNSGTWVRLHRSRYGQTRLAAGRKWCPTKVIMDGQTVKTTERGGVRGFDGHKLAKGRERHILVDTFGSIITNGIESAGISDQRARARPLGGLRSFFPAIDTVMADAGHQSRKLTRALETHEGWNQAVTKCRQRAFKIKSLI